MSYLLGMIAALPELAPALFWQSTREMAARLNAIAADGGRFFDGYDMIADLVGYLRR